MDAKLLPVHCHNGDCLKANQYSTPSTSTRVQAVMKSCRRMNIKRLVQYTIHPVIRCSKSYRKLIIKVLAYMLFIAVLLTVPYFLYHLYVRSVEMYFFQLHVDGRDTHMSSVCMIPNHDPFDSKIFQYLYKWRPVACGRTQPYLTYVDTDGFIHLNLSGIRETGYSEQDYECMYSEIVRCNGTDDKVELTVSKLFRRKEMLHSPFVLAKCILTSGKLVYETGHAHVSSPSTKLLEKNKKIRPGRPSVLMFGLDSLSRLNFIRQLPKTYDFLTRTLGSIALSGMTKVGDNTYPNILTMLTGIAARKKNGVPGPFWGDSKANGYFDDLPLVWNRYSEQGYITMYSEDSPELSAFNYLAKGFVREPTDYYMRPFWLAMGGIRNFRSSDSRCFGNIPQYMYLFNYTQQFVMKMRDLHYFAFSFLTDYSHDYINSVQVIDEDLMKMFKTMHRRGDLNNTLVIVMGDHGNRFDKIRQTSIGRVEERMPFFAVSVPPTLQKRYPHLRTGLQQNANDVLLSWYDVYELLMDVAMDNLEQESRVKRWGTLGYSPFRAVPKNRTCLQAGIPFEYCVCAREQTLEPHEPGVTLVAQDLVKYVNGLLEHAPSGVCAQLMLSEVLSAQLVLPNSQVAQPHGFVAIYRVTVRVSPGGGLLEGTLERDAWSTTTRVVGEVNRINKYGNQSHCVRDKILQLYCYCTDLLATPRTVS